VNPFPYQETDIEHLVNLYKSGAQACVNGSDCGTGKTLVAIEVMKRLGNPATLAVCPKPVIPGWTRAAKLQGTDITAINYEILRTGRTPFGIWRNERFAWSRAVEFLIFDECHRAKGRDSQTSELVRAAKRQGIRTLAMSATLADSPMELDALGLLLGLHEGFRPTRTLRNPHPLSFNQWAERHGCSKPALDLDFGFYGSEASKQKHMANIHQELFPKRGVRTRIENLPDFPDQQVTAELYSLDNPERVNELYAIMREALAKLSDRTADYAGGAMTDLLAARQEVELLKVPVFVSLTQDALSQGQTVLIFINFRATLEELCMRLNTDCTIDGSQVGISGARRRENNRLRIQRDESRVLIGMNEAASLGIDLQDLTGKHPRLELISAPWSAKVVKQLLGRPRRAGAKSKSLARFLFADGTVENRLHAKLSSKLNCLEALCDGDLDANTLQVSNRL